MLRSLQFKTAKYRIAKLALLGVARVQPFAAKYAAPQPKRLCKILRKKTVFMKFGRPSAPRLLPDTVARDSRCF